MFPRRLVAHSGVGPESMQGILSYLQDNREWIFSGVGVFALSGLLFLLRPALVCALSTRDRQTARREPKSQDPRGTVHQGVKQDERRSSGSSGAAKHWQGVVPPESRYLFATRTATGLPAGLQSFSFEYADRGHAYPLRLRGASVRAEIQFSCNIGNPYAALFGAGEYALNILQPRFLSEARGVLEQYSVEEVRRRRRAVAEEICAQVSPLFKELGFSLESVTIGTLEIEKPNQAAEPGGSAAG